MERKLKICIGERILDVEYVVIVSEVIPEEFPRSDNDRIFSSFYRFPTLYTPSRSKDILEDKHIFSYQSRVCEKMRSEKRIRKNNDHTFSFHIFFDDRRRHLT